MAVAESEVLEAIEKLERLSELEPGWDSYDAEPPSHEAIYHARKVLLSLSAADLMPDRIGPTVVNGVWLGWDRDGRKAGIETYNVGGMNAILYGNDVSDGWVVEHVGLTETINRIKTYLTAPPPAG